MRYVSTENSEKYIEKTSPGGKRYVSFSMSVVLLSYNSANFTAVGIFFSVTQ